MVIVALMSGLYYYLAFQHLSYYMEAISLDEVGLLSASVTVFLRMNNPNPLPLHLAATIFDLSINGECAGHGSTASTTIRGYGYQTILAPITIVYRGLYAAVVNSMLFGGTCDAGY